MSYYINPKNIIPYDEFQNYQAQDFETSGKRDKPFDKSVFNPVVNRNINNNYYSLNKGSTRNLKGRPLHSGVRRLNFKNETARPVPFDKSPFIKQINSSQNYYKISANRLSVDQYMKTLLAEQSITNDKKMKELQAAQMFLPNILNKMTEHKKLVQMGILPSSSKPPYTPAEQAYMNFTGNLTPAELLAKFKELEQTQTIVEATTAADEAEDSAVTPATSTIPPPEDEIISDTELAQILLSFGVEEDENVNRKIAENIVDDMIKKALTKLEVENTEKALINKNKRLYDQVVDSIKVSSKRKNFEDVKSIVNDIVSDIIASKKTDETEEFFESDEELNVSDFISKYNIPLSEDKGGEMRYIVDKDVLKSMGKNNLERKLILEEFSKALNMRKEKGKYVVKGTTKKGLLRSDSSFLDVNIPKVISGKRNLYFYPDLNIIMWDK